MAHWLNRCADTIARLVEPKGSRPISASRTWGAPDGLDEVFQSDLLDPTLPPPLLSAWENRLAIAHRGEVGVWQLEKKRLLARWRTDPRILAIALEGTIC